MKKTPNYTDWYVDEEKLLYCLDFSCHECGKKYEKIIFGNSNFPQKCECGCEFKQPGE